MVNFLKNVMRKNIIEFVDGTMHRRIEGDFEYKENGDVEHNAMVNKKSKMVLGDHDNEIYVKCGLVLKHPIHDVDTLYIVNGTLFMQCEKDKNNDEIEKWGDGNYYKRLMLGNEKKLED